MDKLKFENVTFEEKGYGVIVRGSFKNTSDKTLVNVFGTCRFKNGEGDILLFPSLNIMTHKEGDVSIGPFREVEFCHLLTTREAEEVKQCNFEGFGILSVDYDEV